MIIALAQINGRLGDIEGICDRIAEQARLAEQAGAHVMCTPAPLFSGILPGSLVESADYLADLLAALKRLAGEVGVTCLVPAVVPVSGSQLFEVFMLKEGRVVPTRTLLASRRAGDPDDVWAPPVFDIDGVRMGVTFDIERDMDRVPTGTDLMIYFQVSGFDPTEPATSAVAAVPDGHFRDLAENSRRWIACMAPVGAFDEAVYTGGSFVMDDNGRVVAAAPCFEEGLAVQEVRRGRMLPSVPQNELPVFHQDAWLWEALVIYLRDNLSARGYRAAEVLLTGDLPSSLAAALAVDALGSRNVEGVLIERENIYTPAQEAAEQERLRSVRALASALHIGLSEHAAPGVQGLSPAAAPAPERERALVAGAEQLIAQSCADARSACLVSSLTKTDYALAGEGLPVPLMGAIAPFGDVYLTHLEFLGRYRNGVSPVIPSRLVTLNAVEDRMALVLAAVERSFASEADYAEHVAACLARLEATQVDSILDAHVDRNRGAAEIASAALPSDAVRLLLMQVRRTEATRRMLPPAAIVSARSFAERGWPQALAWSDLGGDKDEGLTIEGLVEAEVERFERNAPDAGERIRGEIIGLLGDIFGLDPSEQEQLQSEEGRRRLQEGFERFEQELRRAMGAGGGSVRPPSAPGQVPPGIDPNGYPFFSQN